MDEREGLDTSDRALLAEVLDSCPLSDTERVVFPRWQEKGARLTARMRAWLESVKVEYDRSQRDRELLEALLETGGLMPEEDQVFSDMQSKVESRLRGVMSDAQRAWVVRVAQRLGVAAIEEPLNLHSSGKVREGTPRKERLLPWEQPGYVKPIKPPGRSVR